jgi:beta-lactamase regulating signal transducer with metallopeptidase domain
MNSPLMFLLTNALLAFGLYFAILALKPIVKNPALLHWLCLIVLIKLLTPPIWSPQWRILPAPREVASVSAQEDRATIANGPIESAQAPTADARTPKAMTRAAGAAPTEIGKPQDVPVAYSAPPSPAAAAPEPSPALTSSSPPLWRRAFSFVQQNSHAVILAIWAIGAGALWCVAFWRIFRLDRALKCAQSAPGEVQNLANELAAMIGLRRAPQVLLAPGSLSPMLWAFCAPARIVVPRELFQSLDERAQRSLLLHELAHYKRGDHYVRFLELAAMGVYWWFPIAWLVRREIRRAEELACDAEVIAQLPTERRAYAELLVHTASFASTSSPPALATGIAAVGQLEERLRNIMRSTIDLRVSGGMKILLTLISLGVLPLAPVLVRAQRAENPSAPAQQTGTKESESKKLDWLRGEGESLEIRLRGEIVDSEGKPAADAKLKTSIYDGQAKSTDLPNSVEGNQFEIWVPVGKLSWFSVGLECKSSDGKQLALQRIQYDRLRQAAIDGVKLSLKPYDRTMEIKVVDKNGPVERANVRVDSLMRQDHLLITDKNGIAKLGTFEDDRLMGFTAWTSDHRVGGYSFSRQPTRDIKAATHTIELSACRTHQFRFLNATDKSPVAGIEFTLHIATPPPFYNFIGHIPDSTMTTDARGEAIFAWYPDWPQHHVYTDQIDKHWAKVGKEIIAADGAIEVTVKQSQFANRKKITGHVTSFDGNPAGFAVEMSSFQAEEENRSDAVRAFTDAQGRFTATVLPGSTYCAKIGDGRYVSKMISVLPYDQKTEKMTEPELEIIEGTPVEVTVTQGPNKTPIPGVTVSLRSNHPFSWIEKGETHDGVGSRDWWVKVDDQGKARTWALPGKVLEVRVFEAGWTLEKETNVVAGEVTKIELHRPVVTQFKVAGQFILPADSEASFDDVKAIMSAIDGISKDQREIAVGDNGKFSFETSASKFGVFAYTTDDKAAIASIIEASDLHGPLSLALEPTGEYQGQILDENGAPRKNFPIRASFSIGTTTTGLLFAPTRFSPRTITTKTDADGNFTLAGIPFDMPAWISAGADEGPDSHSLGKIHLNRGEERPREITRLSSAPPKPLPLKDRYQLALRDAKLGGWRMLVVIFNPTTENEEFVNQHFYDYDNNHDVGGFMHVYFRRKDASASPLGNEFAKSLSWPEHKDGSIFALALDAQGKELGRLELDPKNPAAGENASKFVRDFAPQPEDAKKKWDEAFALAAKTNRKVWVRVSQRFCGPCHVLNRWLDDQKELIEKDYVLLKVCNVRDLGGAEVAKRFWDPQTGAGVPFHAIYDAQGAKLIDSTGPLGNIGAPSGFEGGKHLRKMLSTTREKLTDEEIDKLIKSLPK